MQADRNDRHSTEDQQGRHSTQTLVTAVAVLILAGGAYLLLPGGADDEVPAEPAPTQEPAEPRPVMPPRPEPADAIAEAPDIPEPVEASVEETEEPEPEPEAGPPTPPTPEEIDQQMRQVLVEAGLSPAPAPILRQTVAAPYLLDRGVSSIDQLARGLVPERTANLPRPAGAFATTRDGADYTMAEAGYARYDRLVSAITALPVDTLVSVFQRQRGLIADAYAALGYPAASMDNTLIAALDNILAAPRREQPPALVSKGAMWAYADPALENASDLHKQLLRSGPENTAALQRWAQELRSAFLNR